MVLALGLAGGGALGAGCDGQAESDPCRPERPAILTVVYGGRSADVDLGTMTGEREGQLCLVNLADVVAASGLEVDLSQVVVDFEGRDGFRPTSVGCALLPGETLSHGWADKGTGTLVWDESLHLRGCYSVREARKILISSGDSRSTR